MKSPLYFTELSKRLLTTAYKTAVNQRRIKLRGHYHTKFLSMSRTYLVLSLLLSFSYACFSAHTNMSSGKTDAATPHPPPPMGDPLEEWRAKATSKCRSLPKGQNSGDPYWQWRSDKW